jgi:RNA polymerase sigma factor (sigma-70 family)
MDTAQLGTLLRHIQTLAASRRHERRSDRQLLEDFTAGRDEAAFAALVARHGPLVLRVCRRMLAHEQDAEDAFQATFLVLARHTGSIRRREALAAWLHGVAYRTAMRAKRSAARRRNHEARFRSLAPAAASNPTWNDVQAVLDEEIQRLPAPFRAAFVLCVLEGRSGPEAAAELGVKPGTVSSRLTRARQRLRQRLAQRGIQLSVLLAAVSVAESTARAAVPGALAQAAVDSGLLAAAGGAAVGGIPSRVAALSAGVTRAMLLTRIKAASSVLLLAVGLAAAGTVVLTGRDAAADSAAPASPKPQAQASRGHAVAAAGPTVREQHQAVQASGRVFDPSGRPVAGARLCLFYRPSEAWAYVERPMPAPAHATTGPDGRFHLASPTVRFLQKHQAVVVATAKGFGPAWVEVDPRDGRKDLSIRLVRDDVPIAGRVVDLQGRPLRGVAVRMLNIRASPQEDLDPWVAAAGRKAGASFELESQYLPRLLACAQVPELAQSTTTDADGGFRLAGLGRERLVTVRLDAPTIASQEVHILTRPGQPIQLPAVDWAPERGGPLTTLYHPAAFRLVAGATRPVVGAVRDRDTGKPLAAATIESYQLANDPLTRPGFVRTTTDAAGRYRLVGLPKGEGNRILVIPAEDQPYLEVLANVANTPALDAVRVDFRLNRAIWIEGRLTDKATGKPLQAVVGYFARVGNTHLREHAGYDGPIGNPFASNVREDGTFRVAGLPGPGFLSVVSSDRYLVVIERDDQDGTRDLHSRTIPVRVSTEGMNALAPIDPPQGVKSFRRNIVLDPGETYRGTVLGPDGTPLAGARVLGLSAWGGWSPPLETASFTVRAFNPRRPRRVFFLHAERRLVGVLDPARDRAAPLRVRLGPAAAVTGRLVDADGRPRGNVRLDVAFRRSWLVGYFPGEVRTDHDGRFHIDALLPGQRFQLYEGSAEVRSFGNLRPGQTQDLGDVRPRR